MTEIVLRPANEIQAVAARHVEPVLKKLATGGGYDLAHEFKSVWGDCWRELLEQGRNPKAAGIYLLAIYYNYVTDQQPDFAQLGRLVGRWGKAALAGLDEAIARNIEPPFAYAHTVCKTMAVRARSDDDNRHLRVQRKRLATSDRAEGRP